MNASSPHRKVSGLLLAILAIAFSFSPDLASANAPGGVTGPGPDVTVKDSGDDTVTMANGIASIFPHSQGL
jgi:hypothetical protein